MAFLLRFLGLSSEGEAAVDRDDDSGVVRRIAAQLERLDPETARYLAAFAYVLARVANADLNISKTETEAMQEILESKASLAPEEAALVVEIAKSQSRLLGFSLLSRRRPVQPGTTCRVLRRDAVGRSEHID